jgi:hypothetical protein
MWPDSPNVYASVVAPPRSRPGPNRPWPGRQRSSLARSMAKT